MGKEKQKKISQSSHLNWIELSDQESAAIVGGDSGSRSPQLPPWLRRMRIDISGLYAEPLPELMLESSWEEL
ncbi:MAG: hypothetical protein WA919_24360 [Coleofasciculaceae cyanobacterium]